jgi:hypothetical protein
MQFVRSVLLCCALIVLISVAMNAQDTASSTTAIVPRLVNFSGKASDDEGKPVTGIVGITFAIYNQQQGGMPLWMETQNVTADTKGNYTVQLGANTSEGLPLDLFASGEARWLGVRVNGGEEQARVLLLSVPYALKAADAQTLGGLPAAAFVLASPNVSTGTTSASPSAAPGAGPSVGGSGTEDYIPLWTDNNGDLGNSILYQSGTGSSAKIGINEKSPLETLDVNGSELVRGLFEMATTSYANKNKGFNSNPLNLESSAFNSSTGAYTLNHFQWQAEPTGNNTTTPGATLNLLYGTDPANPAETGLQLSSKGIFTFATAQTFPGTGTITGVTTSSGSGLSGGGTSGNLSLGLVNTCAANQVLQWNGTAWVCAAVGTGTITGVTAGSDLTGGGSSGTVTLNLNKANVPLLAANNTFSGNNSFGGTGGFPIFAQTTAASGTAIEGRELATSGPNSTGVYGSTQDPTGSGVSGYNSGSSVGQSALGIGVSGTSAYGIGVAGNGAFVGVYGQTNGGVNLFNPYGGAAGVYGVSFVYGNNNAVGVEGVGYTAPQGSDYNGGIGILAFGGNSNSTLQNQGGGDGIDSYGGEANNTAGAGGRFFGGLGSSNGDGIDVTAGSGVAAFFVGDVVISGTLQKSGGSFKIDHPLDPANKYLYHSFVESPDMKNIYDGVATLDANGESVIQMPEWFGVLNRDFRYQLTCIGGFAPVYIAEELANNQFKIGGGRDGMRVSWQITGIRQDAWANAHRIPVEEEKEARLKGFYIHPELYGAPPEKQIEYARHPQQMKRMKENRQQMNEKQAPLIPPAALPHGSTK